MNNVIEFRFNGKQIEGFQDEMYLGAADVGLDGDFTKAMHAFNLPTAVAPTDWPVVHRTIDGKVIRRGK